ncbi:MAG: lytic transglycosylase domain-containing protein [Pseudomonadota bacterium]
MKIKHITTALILLTILWIPLQMSVNLSKQALIAKEEAELVEKEIQFLTHIIDAAEEYDMDPALIAAIIRAESSFNPNARSPVGAKGLMQINGITARHLGITNLYDPKTNIQAGTMYLRELKERFNGNLKLTIAAYNAGPTAVSKYKSIPPYKETKQYVKKVLEYYQEFRSHSQFSG